MNDPSAASHKLFQAGKNLAHPPPGEEIVISGISGRFPASSNIKEFADNLLNKTDMITTNRWKINHPEIPPRAGSLRQVNKFDCGAFGIHPVQGDVLIPITRNLLELVFEAICDAGVNLREIEGTKTGVFISVSNTDCRDAIVKHDVKPPTEAYAEMFSLTVANMISYTLKVNGPSTVLDTGCNTTLHTLEQAYRALRNGEIDSAIIGGGVINLIPAYTMQCSREGVLSKDGFCRTFDQKANGYVKSEAVGAIFIQRRKDARRVYSEVVYCKVGCDGFKEEGITYPSSKEQENLLSQLCEECGLKPSEVSYVETHGTGTKVGDVQEAAALDNALAKKRESALPIGSVKTNVGHTETVAGFCQLAKAIIAMETGFVAPNLHFSEPKREIEGLQKGRLKVVTEKMAFPANGFFLIDSFGLGGSDAFVVLKPHGKVKRQSTNLDLSRLVCVSGRTYDAVKNIFDDVTSRQLDIEYITLLNDLHRWNIPTHTYRASIILHPSKKETQNSIVKCDFSKNDLCLIFGDCTMQLLRIGREIFELPLGKQTCESISELLRYDFAKLLNESVINTSLVTTLVQIVIVHLLKLMDLNPKVVSVSPCGIFAKAYSKNVLTFEETILSASLAVTIKEGKNEKGNSNITLKILRNSYNAKTQQNHIMKTILKYIATSQKSPNIPCDKQCVLLTFGRVSKELREENGFLLALSRIYQEGFNFDINKVYPKLHYPVSSTTPMISPLIKWEHSRNFHAITYNIPNLFHKLTRIDANDPQWNFLHDHIVDGIETFPEAGYIYSVWDAIAFKIGKTVGEVCVAMKDVQVTRDTAIPKDGKLEFMTAIHCASGRFKLFESGAEVLTGTVMLIEQSKELVPLKIKANTNDMVLNEDDVYKELKLRGYQYRGRCRGIQKSSTDFRNCLIKWENQWVSFIDCVLQLYILTMNTRGLFIPSYIQNITINPKLNDSKYCLLPCNFLKETSSVSCGGVQMTRISANEISKKSFQNNVLLEEHRFVPNELTTISLQESARINTQIALEINSKVKIKIVELVNGQSKRFEILMPHILESLKDQNMVEAEAVVLTKDREISFPNIKFEKSTLEKHDGVFMVIGWRLLESPEKLERAFESLIEDGFILSRESLSSPCNDSLVNILTVHCTPQERLILIAKRKHRPLYKTLKITNDFEWIQSLLELIAEDDEIILYSQFQNTGILGFTNCLRREGKKVRGVLISDSKAPAFDPSNKFYQKQLETGHALNVYKDGMWGTYRYFRIEAPKDITSPHCYSQISEKGNLESFKWIQGHLNETTSLQSHQELVYIYYAALNSKDVTIVTNREQQNMLYGPVEQPLLGMEYSGKLPSGRRVMGITQDGGAIATLIAGDKDLMLDIPNDWTLEEAATIPVAYAVALFALKQKACIKTHQSILIHSASDAVGQAAINICNGLGLHIFTTVKNSAQKSFLQKTFPFLKASHIGSCKDESFGRMVKVLTKGRGVDVVLSSLPEEMLEASLKCLSSRGTYLEISKLEVKDRKSLMAQCLTKEIQFHNICFDQASSDEKRRTTELLREELKKGTVKPLDRIVFDQNKVSEAFKFIIAEKHTGKVLIKTRKGEERHRCSCETFSAIPRYHPTGSVMVTGGLGGIGMELINWLISRGARHVLIAARRTELNGYEAARLRVWKEKGVETRITTDNLTTEEGCKCILEKANSMAPLGSIFHLAAIMADTHFENQTQDNFQRSFAVKAGALQHLDKLTRNFYPTLKDFVVFSSTSSVRCFPGQTNYVYANSTMERICEKRQKYGFPVVAIQWGVVGEVGIVHRLKQEDFITNMTGLLPQSVSSCLDTLDELLAIKAPILSSIVLKEKGSTSSSEKSLTDVIANIIGIRDLKVINVNVTLAELGMDSNMATVIKQTLETQFEIVLSYRELRRQTFRGLEELKKR